MAVGVTPQLFVSFIKENTMASLFTQLNQSFQAWKARRDNPNQVTAGQLGAETKTTTNATLNKYSPKNVLPISYAGNCLDIRDQNLPLTSFSGAVFVVQSFPAMFGGIDVTVTRRTVNLMLISSDYKNRTGYLYLKYNGTTVEWDYQTNMGVDTGTSIRVGTVTCDANGQITAMSVKKTFLLGTTRMMG